MIMRKLITILLTLTLLASACTVVAFADEKEEYLTGNFWMLDADKTEEILAEGAGIDSTRWEVPYLEKTPVMDGVVEKDEYGVFSDFEDYMSLMARADNGPDLPATSAEDFHDFRVQYDTFQGDNSFINAYWGWDGEYLYMAFVVQNLNGFHCDPDQDWLLYAYNCLQIGVGDEYAMGKEYTELGFGVNSTTGEPLTYTWIGEYKSDPEADYGGKYDEDEGIVTYECRIKLSETVGLYNDEDDPIAPGDVMKFAWLVSVNGQGNRTETGSATEGQEWQVGFCHGIGGPYAYKAAEYFALATFGAPEGYVTETEPETEAGTEGETVPETEAETAMPESETVVETRAETVADSETAATTEPNGTTPETKSEETGCGSVVTVSAGVLILAMLGCVTVFRKKED